MEEEKHGVSGDLGLDQGKESEEKDVIVLLKDEKMWEIVKEIKTIYRQGKKTGRRKESKSEKKKVNRSFRRSKPHCLNSGSNESELQR